MKYVLSIIIILFIGNVAAATDNDSPLFPIYVKGKIGYIDTCGNIVVKPKYQTFIDIGFVDGFARVHTTSKSGQTQWKWGYINQSGQLVIDIMFKDAQDFSGGFAAVKIGNKWGYINTNGVLVIKPQYIQANNFSEEMALVATSIAENGYIYNYRFIDTTGNTVFALDDTFATANDFSEGLAPVFYESKRIDTGSKLLNRANPMIINDVVYVDKFGSPVITLLNCDVKDFSEGRAAVGLKPKYDPDCYEITYKWGYIDTTGKIVVVPKYSFAGRYSEGLAAVAVISDGQISNARKYGYIDTSGNMIIKPKEYREVLEFSEGLAAVCKNNKWGYIDKTGKYAIWPQFSKASSFKYGIARVEIFIASRQYGMQVGFRPMGYINKYGKFIWKSALN